MKQALPCGSPFIYKRSGNVFSFQIGASTSGWSWEAQDWLNFMSYDERFLTDDGTYYRMETALTGEHGINHNGDVYYVDGFIKTKNQTFILEYYGCRYHTCIFCCGVKRVNIFFYNEFLYNEKFF